MSDMFVAVRSILAFFAGFKFGLLNQPKATWTPQIYMLARCQDITPPHKRIELPSNITEPLRAEDGTARVGRPHLSPCHWKELPMWGSFGGEAAGMDVVGWILCFQSV